MIHLILADNGAEALAFCKANNIELKTAFAFNNANAAKKAGARYTEKKEDFTFLNIRKNDLGRVISQPQNS